MIQNLTEQTSNSHSIMCNYVSNNSLLSICLKHEHEPNKKLQYYEKGLKGANYLNDGKKPNLQCDICKAYFSEKCSLNLHNTIASH